MIVLHIGTDKTGSTAIQKLLYYNREKLKKYGWNYPMEFGMAGYRHPQLFEMLVKNDFKKINNVLLANNFENSNYIISFEGFYGLSEEIIKRFLSLLKDKLSKEIKIIIYIRKQDEKEESGVLQGFKMGRLKALKGYRFKYKKDLDYYQIIKKWERFVGKENVIVRPYGKKFLPEKDSLIKDFFKYALNLDYEKIKDKLIIPERDPNPSIDAVSGYVLDFLDDLGVDELHKFLMIYQLIGIEQREGKSKKSLFNKKEREKILSIYKEGNESLIKEYNIPKELFELDEKEYEKPTKEDILERLSKLYDRKEYLLPLKEWEGEGNFVDNIKNYKIYLIRGFYQVEKWGVWSKGEETSKLGFLVFRDFFNGSKYIDIKIDVQYNNNDTKSYMRVYGNEWQVLQNGENVYRINAEEIAKNGGVVLIEFKHENPKSPKELGINEDIRILGCGIKNITFKEIV